MNPVMYVAIIIGLVVVVGLATWVEHLTRPDPVAVAREARRRAAQRAADREAHRIAAEAARVDVDAWLDYPEGGQS